MSDMRCGYIYILKEKPLHKHFFMYKKFLLIVCNNVWVCHSTGLYSTTTCANSSAACVPPIGVWITLLTQSLASNISVTTPPQLNVLFNTSVRFSMNQPVVVLTSEPDHTVVYTWYSSGSNGTYDKESIACEAVLPSYPLAALNATLMVCVRWIALI